MRKKRIDLTSEYGVLIDFLARADGLFSPPRDCGLFSGSAAGAIFTTQSHFRADGIPLPAAAASAADRVRMGRTIDKLAEASLLIRSATKETARLTSEGDLIARSLCDLPPISLTFDRMRKLARIAQSEDGIGQGSTAIVREVFLIDERDYRNDDGFKFELSYLRTSLAAALWRGWVKGLADVQRRAHYALTPAGVAILGRGMASEPEATPRGSGARMERSGQQGILEHVPS